MIRYIAVRQNAQGKKSQQLLFGDMILFYATVTKLLKMGSINAMYFVAIR